jgi:hypothetical protein
MKNLNAKILLIGLLWGPCRTFALDAFEIQVYDAGINEQGKYSIETHLNTVPSGITAPGYQGQVPNNQMSHMTFEFARGMNEYWEVGSYLQTALLPNGNYDFAGTKLRSKFVLPSKLSGNFQIGINFEISYIPQNFEQYFWASEIRTILGYSWARWSLITNPIFGLNLVNNLSQPPTFEPSAKLEFDTRLGFGVGAEYYSDLGPAPSTQPLGPSEQYLFASFDLIKGPIEFNAGLGGGLNSPPNTYSNATVLKVILGTDF